MKEVVKELRMRLKLSQMQVAEITGVSIVSVNRSETGKVKLSTYQRIIDGLIQEEIRRKTPHNYPASGLCYF